MDAGRGPEGPQREPDNVKNADGFELVERFEFGPNHPRPDAQSQDQQAVVARTPRIPGRGVRKTAAKKRPTKRQARASLSPKWRNSMSHRRNPLGAGRGRLESWGERAESNSKGGLC